MTERVGVLQRHQRGRRVQREGEQLAEGVGEHLGEGDGVLSIATPIARMAHSGGVARAGQVGHNGSPAGAPPRRSAPPPAACDTAVSVGTAHHSHRYLLELLISVIRVISVIKGF